MAGPSVIMRGGWRTGPRDLIAEFQHFRGRPPTPPEVHTLERLRDRNASVFAFEGHRAPNRTDEADFNTAQNLASFYVNHGRGPDGADPVAPPRGGPETEALVRASVSAVPPKSSLFREILHSPGILSGQWLADTVARKVMGEKLYHSLTPANIRAANEALHNLGRGELPKNPEALAVAGLAAAGKTEALSSPALSKARAAIPGGIPVKVGFDLGAAVATHAGKASPPEAIAAARAALRTPQQRAAFDAAVGLVHQKTPSELAEHAGTLSPAAVAVFGRAVAAGKVAQAVPIQEHAAEALRERSRVRARGLSARARSWVSGAIRVKARRALARDTRGLNPGGGTYTVEPNDSAWRIAQNLTGDGNHHYRELIRANSPPKTTVGSGSTLNFKYLRTGEILKIPATWKLIVPIPPAAVATQAQVSPVVSKVAPAPAPSVQEVTTGAGETWRIDFKVNRSLSSSEAATVKTKMTAAFVKAGSSLVAWSFSGTSGSLTVKYGNGDTLRVGASAAVSVEANSPIVTLVAAVKLAGAPGAAAPVPVAVTAPKLPEPGFNEDDPKAIAQAKAILVAWEHTDGAAAAGLPDYGGRPEDQSPIWGERDKLELMAFCAWANAHGSALALVGDLTQEKLDALVAWSENKAKAAAPGGAMVTSAPSTAPAQAPAPGAAATVATGPEIMPETEITATPEPATAGMGDSGWGLLIALGLGGALLLSSKKRKARAAA